MSIVKRFEIQCDQCRCRHEWTHEMVANAKGVTKGNGTLELRKQVKAMGWHRKQVKPKVWIDRCPECSLLPTPSKIWFEE